MLVLNAEQIRALALMPRLIDCLREAFRSKWMVPPREVNKVPGSSTGERLLLTMSAFDPSGGGAVKLATVFPDNPAMGLPSIQGAILVFSDTGTPVALLDGAIITRLRTSAASALASTYLSRPDSSHLVIIGTGALASYMALAHTAVRPIVRISICGRNPGSVASTTAAIRLFVGKDVEVIVPNSIEEAVAAADIVSCATSSPIPVLCGKWLKPGAFVDAVGSFSPSKRETDDDVVRRARIFVDTFEGAFAEAGDILDPVNRGIIGRDCIEGEMADLVSGRSTGRIDADEITMFKSVGTAIEDLAASRLVVAAAAQGAET
jgi:ornithine cyclodeaminase/alanine dehydrogenase-like protein (mu-crystallin family)